LKLITQLSSDQTVFYKNWFNEIVKRARGEIEEGNLLYLNGNTQHANHTLLMQQLSRTCESFWKLKDHHFLSKSSIPWIGGPSSVEVFSEDILKLHIFVQYDTFNSDQLIIKINETVFEDR
jgi:hypothetical protein